MRLFVGTGITLALASFISQTAFPCGNAVMLQNDEASKMVAKAESDLQAGRYRKALDGLYHGDIEVNSRPLQRRIDLVTSTARLRLGRFTEAAWAFDALSQQDPKDTVVQTRLGETLAGLGTKAASAKALEILSALETRDLIADEYGFLALAKLREGNGDAAGRDRALTRCRAMAKDAAFCTLTRAAPKTKSKAPGLKAYGDGKPTS